MLILFTTGATVTFHKLVAHVAEPGFLDGLAQLGFDSAVLQYGNETDERGRSVSKQYFSDVIASNGLMDKLDLSIRNSTNDKSVVELASNSFSLKVFGFSASISDYISAADIVVSHAGTGSILDTLRLKKPLIVVTNSALMDNHQQEVADRFELEGYLASITTEQLAQGRLHELLAQFKKGKLQFKELPDPPAGVLAGVLAEELNRH